MGVLIMIVLVMTTLQVYGTVFRRRERRVYVALWYAMAALIWTAMNYPLGNFILPFWINGVNSAALHGLYIHYVVGLWITPAGLALIYFFLPSSVRNPLYSHKLSLIGFWSIAFLYPFLGIHHYLYSPIAEWTQTVAIAYGILLIIPVWTVTTNFFGTMFGKWHTLAGKRSYDYATKFLILGAVNYFVGCFQGSVEALRRMQQLTHFSDFTISHSHMTVFGTFVIWVTGGLYYIWPRITGTRALELAVGELAFLARPLRRRTDGGDFVGDGIHPGGDARVRGQFHRQRRGDEAVVDGANVGRHGDGYRDGAFFLQPLAERPRWRAD
ncbi:MAG: cbb3-type cytochrome c oxidase subunit I [Candidatus Manganitrophus sp.]|nr:cbb3-type cytochrome c oxidase subunit I [Candidatus Manganitrophus sp.]